MWETRIRLRAYNRVGIPYMAEIELDTLYEEADGEGTKEKYNFIRAMKGCRLTWFALPTAHVHRCQ